MSLAAITLVAASQLVAACVDGVTPDCTDPRACAPNGGGDAAAGSIADAEPAETGAAAEAGADADGGGVGSDAGLDADADGG